MAHSYIIGKGLEFEVRDSICESILGRLKDQLAKNGATPSLQVVTEWFDYWFATPPGCKELTLEPQTPEIREIILSALSVVISMLDQEGEQLRVAKQVKEILMKS